MAKETNPVAEVSPEDAKVVAEAKLREGKILIDDNPEKAVEVLCDAVKILEKAYGAEALECAPAYLYYGIALFEVARKATDALGTAKTTVDQPAEANPDVGGEDAGAAVGEGEAEEATGDDMRLAWDMIELARVIFSRHQSEQHNSMLAEVHKGLGDINSEEEKFEDAIESYHQSIMHMEALQPPPKRRIAEVQYKLAMVLTFQEMPQEALSQTQAALATLEGAVAEIEDKLVALPTDGSGGEEVEAEGRRLQDTANDLRDVMGELRLNMEGLNETIANNNSFKEALKQAMLKAASEEGGASGAAGALAAIIQSNSFAAPSNRAATTERVSLGVVGRGTKRISAAPVAAASAQSAGPAKPADSVSSAASGPTAKRTLADLMGGAPMPGGGTAAGFGAVAVVEKRAEAEPQPKKARAEVAPPAPAPEAAEAGEGAAASGSDAGGAQ